MNLVMMLMALMLVGVCFLLSINCPYEFLILWGMLASGYDANGIVKYMDTYFGSFSLLMNSVMIIALVFSIWRYNKQTRKRFNMFLISGGMLTIWIILCFVFVSRSSGMGIYNVVYTICDYSPIVMMIWMLNHDYYVRKGRKPVNYILFFVSAQVIFAFLIVYLPEIGIHILDKFSGANYIADGYAYNNSLFHIQDIFSALKSKYLFDGLGQFHNGNDMGFFGVTGVVCAIILMLKNEMKYKILSIFLFMASVLLWGNSGMRGPVIGAAIGLIIYLFFPEIIQKFY